MTKLSAVLKQGRIPYVSAVIVAAGSGTRFGGDKLMTELGGCAVLLHTLRVFEESPMIQEIVLVARKDALVSVHDLCAANSIQKITNIVPGGATRAHSCYAGVTSVSGRAEIIAIHDGARPLVTEKIIEEALWQAYRRGAAVPAVPVRDTVKKAKDGIVYETPDRSDLYAVQTPQCFQADVIRAALTDALKNAPQITDDCMAVERIGGKIFLTEGSEENLKITTPLDLALAEIILKGRANR